MKTHTLVQGSAEWQEYRRSHDNASDAPAMMGCSPYKTRSQFLHERHTGLTADVDAGTQRRFDDGHRFEALARPLAEEIVGQELFPATGSSGKLSASFDGLVMDETIAWEHKTLSAELRAIMPAPELVEHEPCNAIIPLHYRVQMEQQCMVSGASSVLFMATKWDGDNLVEARHCWYESDGALADAIYAGWEQFHKDLDAYVPPVSAKPAPTGRAPETLPALLITVRGEVTDSNLASFKEVALAAIRSVNRDLKTDQDFADADKAVKWCSDIEDRVAAAKQHALSQTATIDSLFKTMDDISAEARQVRLDLEKLVKARKVSLKTEMLTEAQTALGDHIRSLNARLGRDYMPHVPVDFAGAIASKRNFDSMRAALDATLANAKIAANATADKIQINLNYLQEDVPQGHAFLFADLSTIVLKANDDFRILVDSRIATHKAKKAQEEADTRERIRAEEQAKAEKAARDLAEAEDLLITSIWKNARRIEGDTVGYIQKAIGAFESGAKDFADDARPRVVAAITEARAEMAAKLETAQIRETAEAARRLEQNAASAAAMQGITGARQADSLPAPILDAMEGVATNLIADLAVGRAAATSANVVPMRAAAPAPAAAPATPPTLKLGQIGERLGFSLTGEFLKSLGFEPAARDKAALLFHEADFPLICMRLVAHIQGVQARQAA